MNNVLHLWPHGRNRACLATWALVAIVFVPPGAASAAPETRPKKVGHVTAQAFADRTAISPGGTVSVAVSLTSDKDWYIYWQNPGGLLGLPTKIRWTAMDPSHATGLNMTGLNLDGYRVGRPRYPVPQVKFDKALDATTYILDGKATVLSMVSVPASAVPGSEATFSVKASWLVCRKACIPGEVELSFKLPVVAKGTKVKPANVKVFERAREALPLPMSKAEHVKLSGTVDPKAVGAGGEFSAVLTVEIAAKHHMQSNKPFQDYLIPAVLFVESTDGLEIGDVKYPEPHVRQDKMLGKLSEYGGKVAFEIPVAVEVDAGEEPRTIRGVLQYQICTDSGTCFRPQHIEFAIGVPAATADSDVSPVEGEAAPDGPAAGGDQATTVAESGVSPDPGGTVPEDEAGGAEEADSDTGGQAAIGTQAAGGPPAASGSHAASEQEAAEPVVAGAVDGPGPSGTEEVSQEDRSILIRLQDRLFAFGFAGVLLAGFIGGLVLNLMPCVLPVISLKVLSFVRQAHEDRWRIFRMGLVYSSGIMVFFIFLAIIFFVWNKGWGELFQYPIFVIVMAAVVLAFALSLFGVFALFTPKIVNELGQKAESQEGYLSAFSTGVLATLLGTACTAPFLSAAIGYAAQLPPVQGASIFLAVGLGMASPIVVLTYNPAWLRFVPKPGPWMGVFEAIMGFVLLGTVIWLINPLRVQLGAYGLLMSLIFLLAVAVAVWIKGKIEFGAPAARKVRLYAIAAVVIVVGWLFPFGVMSTIPELIADQTEHHDLLARGMRAKYGKNLDWSRGIPWQPYVRDLALGDVGEGYTVFVDYTASWCASCKVNLKAFIDQPEVIAVMRELGVIPYEADYSLYNPELKRDLDRYGRAGVPMYLVYRPGDTEVPEVLPEFLTKQTIIDALRRAGPTKLEIVKPD